MTPNGRRPCDSSGLVPTLRPGNEYRCRLGKGTSCFAKTNQAIVRQRNRLNSITLQGIVRLLLVLLTSGCSALCWFGPPGCWALSQVPNRHTVASVSGDLVIGVLIPVHERPSQKQAATRTCGPVREQYGIQRVEAALQTLDFINLDKNILPNISLGVEIRDSCWFSPIALEQSIEFIRDAMAASEQSSRKQQTSSLSSPSNASQSTTSAVVPVILPEPSTPPQCAPYVARSHLQQSQSGKSARVKNIVGVVGPASSGDTVQVQHLLQLFEMPQVGYSATSRDLSNKNFYKYFLRVVPSDKLQAQVLIDLMLAHQWTYITVVYTEGSYGSSLMNAFRERAQEKDICFATLESMPPNADEAKFDELIDVIKKHSSARVIVCACEGRTVSQLFEAFKRKNVSSDYLIVGGDGWSDRFDVVNSREQVALGGVSVRIHSAYVSDFDPHYFSLTPQTNLRNPWFGEFWEQKFHCNLLDAHASSGRPAGSGFARPPGAKVYPRNCTGNESLRLNYNQDSKLAFVQKSIITMALGLDSMQRATCGPQRPGLCPEMLPLNGSILLEHLMNVSFRFLDEYVSFDEQGDPPGQYEILNFRRRRAPNATRTGTDIEGAISEDHSTTPFNESPDQHLSTMTTTTTDLDFQVSRAGGDPEPAPATPSTSSSWNSLEVLRPSEAPSKAYKALQQLHQQQKQAATRRPNPTQPPASATDHDHAHPTTDYEYVAVGSWTSGDGLRLFGKFEWPKFFGYNEAPKSVCSLPCKQGHAKKVQSDSVKCCWICVACKANEYLAKEDQCTACAKGEWPNATQTGCERIPIEHFDWQSAESLGAISIALVGLILTLATAIVFMRHNETPVVKASTRELGYVILFAMVLCYITTFFLIAKPSFESCVIVRCLPGCAFSMMYGALVTKTNRIARILAGSKKKIITRRPRFMSATSQVVITCLLIIIECCIIAVMLYREPAGETLAYPTDVRVLLVCSTSTEAIMVPLGFDFLLICLCAWYAFKTRNVPENFNEAKFIGFAMYTTIVIWIAFVAIYLSNENHQVVTQCLCISFSALIALFLLFFPKCYIIICKPEKNNRSFFTTIKHIRCHIGYQQPPPSSVGAVAPPDAAHNHKAAGQPQSSLGQLDCEQLSAMAAHEFAQNSHNQHPSYHDQQPQWRAHKLSRLASRSAVAGVAPLASLPRASQALVGPFGELPEEAPAAIQTSKEPSGSRHNSLLEQLNSLLLFGRGYRRKNSSKASSIQQHLMAIRHAENLDRQTHSRRSQVQRTAQRFDSSAAAQFSSRSITVSSTGACNRRLNNQGHLINDHNNTRSATMADAISVMNTGCHQADHPDHDDDDDTEDRPTTNSAYHVHDLAQTSGYQRHFPASLHDFEQDHDDLIILDLGPFWAMAAHNGDPEERHFAPQTLRVPRFLAQRLLLVLGQLIGGANLAHLIEVVSCNLNKASQGQLDHRVMKTNRLFAEVLAARGHRQARLDQNHDHDPDIDPDTDNHRLALGLESRSTLSEASSTRANWPCRQPTALDEDKDMALSNSSRAAPAVTVAAKYPVASMASSLLDLHSNPCDRQLALALLTRLESFVSSARKRLECLAPPSQSIEGAHDRKQAARIEHRRNEQAEDRKHQADTAEAYSQQDRGHAHDEHGYEQEMESEVEQQELNVAIEVAEDVDLDQDPIKRTLDCIMGIRPARPHVDGQLPVALPAATPPTRPKPSRAQTLGDRSSPQRAPLDSGQTCSCQRPISSTSNSRVSCCCWSPTCKLVEGVDGGGCCEEPINNNNSDEQTECERLGCHRRHHGGRRRHRSKSAGRRGRSGGRREPSDFDSKV